MLVDHRSPPFLLAEALRHGIGESFLRGPSFVALHRGVLVGSAVAVGVGERVLAASLRGGPGAVVAGPLAALAWGVDCPWSDGEVVVPSDHRTVRESLRFRTDRLPDEEVAFRRGVALTTPLRTAMDLACRRSGDFVEAVAAVDALAHGTGFGPADLAAALARHPGVRGSVGAREVVASMDPRAESLTETRTRVGLVLRGLPRPVSQHPVRLPSGRSVRLDLAWPDPPSGRPTAVEYDGWVHREIGHHGLDLERQAALEDLGWTVVRVTRRQLAHLDAVAARVGRLLGVVVPV